MCFIYDLTEYVVAWVTPAKGNIQFAESLAYKCKWKQFM